MGDLISNSAFAPAAADNAEEEVAEGTATTGATADGPSSYWVGKGPPFGPRLSLILKSCRSSSNSEMEFFFIRSIIALMSFKSTDCSRSNARRPEMVYRSKNYHQASEPKLPFDSAQTCSR